jgi:hypothetical protein
MTPREAEGQGRRPPSSPDVISGKAAATMLREPESGQPPPPGSCEPPQWIASRPALAAVSAARSYCESIITTDGCGSLPAARRPARRSLSCSTSSSPWPRHRRKNRYAAIQSGKPAGSARLLPAGELVLPGDSSWFDCASLDSDRGLLFVAYLGGSEIIEIDVDAQEWFGSSAA